MTGTGRRIAAAALLAALLGGWSLLVAAPSGAQVSGACQATVAGVDVRTADSPSSAVEVGAKDTVVVTATSPTPIDTYEVELELAGLRWTVASGDADGTTWSDTVEIKDYATYGVGLYKVHGVSRAGGAEECRGTAYIEVTGKSPLTTVAGVAGAAGLLGGIGLMAMAGFRR